MAVTSVPALLELSVRRAIWGVAAYGGSSRPMAVGQADYRTGVRDRVCYGRTCTGVCVLLAPSTNAQYFGVVCVEDRGRPKV